MAAKRTSNARDTIERSPRRQCLLRLEVRLEGNGKESDEGGMNSTSLAGSGPIEGMSFEQEIGGPYSPSTSHPGR